MKKKILVVDDEPALTRVIKRTLELSKDRFEVRTENSGDAALATAREFQPDLVLLDVMMPDMDGPEVAERLRADPGLKQIKIVFLTAIVTKQETSPTGSDIGGNIFLAKPVKREDLVACIDKQLA